jgi:DNA-binding phage protein
MAKKNLGSGFDDFLEEEGILEEVKAVAVKRYIAYQLAQKMSEKNLSKSEMARLMETSRSALDRLLDPDNASVTLQTLQSAVQALGGRLNVELQFDSKAARVA